MITGPEPSASRSRIADWLELTSLLRGRSAGSGDLDSLLRMNSDNDRLRTVVGDGGQLENEIAEQDREELSSRVGDEIVFRAATLGGSYPFEVDSDPLKISLKRVCNDSSHAAYIFMLLMSAARDSLLPKSASIIRKIDEGRRLFHLCACFGVAGLLFEGHAYWFGFPRPEKTGFAVALTVLSKLLGYSIPLEPPPAGLPTRPKDDQVDIIGWRAFSDRRIGTLFIICQAATGDDWDGKSVYAHLGAFLDWFDRGPYRLAMPSLAIPFPVYHEVEEPSNERDDYEKATFNALQRLNGRHGVVLDRLRIVECVDPIARDPVAVARLHGAIELSALSSWISELKPELAQVA